jgi:hypothetical protein
MTPRDRVRAALARDPVRSTGTRVEIGVDILNPVQVSAANTLAMRAALREANRG